MVGEILMLLFILDTSGIGLSLLLDVASVECIIGKAVTFSKLGQAVV